jgi:hypothetical protein
VLSLSLAWNEVRILQKGCRARISYSLRRLYTIVSCFSRKQAQVVSFQLRSGMFGPQDMVWHSLTGDIQRAHGNYLENHYMALTTLLIGGLRYPLLSSAFGLVWSLGRVVYALGYTSKTKDNGKGRLAGAFFWLAQLGLFVNAGLTGYNLAFN